MPKMMMQSAEYYFKQGNTFYFEGQYEEAIASYDKALELNSGNSDAWNNRGVALANLKRYEEAITSYDKALKLNSGNSDAWNNRGVTLANLKRYEEAITSYDKALEFNSDFFYTWFNRACCHGLQGKVEETINALKKATELNSICREKAKTDPDFDKVRQDERFQKLIKDQL
jgi:tetratricopeptide (TPR) repeat protein